MKTFFFGILFFSITSLYSQSCIFDTTKINLEFWKIDKFNNFEYQEIDTSLYGFQIFHPDDRNSFSNNDLATLSSPRLSNIFALRPQMLYQDFFFISDYQTVMFEPHKFEYYKTDKPYTNILYTTTPKVVEEIFIDLVHTQNLNEKTNIGVNYSLTTSKEPVTTQNSAQNNFTAWFSRIDERYSVHANFYSNRIKIIENGGTVDTTEEFRRDQLSYYLNDVRSKMINTGVYVNQEYKLGSKKTVKENDTVFNILFTARFAVGHIFNIKGFHRKYYENTSTGNFYSNNYLQDDFTYDSVYYAQTLNTFHLRTLTDKFLGIKSKNRIAISSELNKFFLFNDYFFNNKSNYQHNTFITTSVAQFQIKKFESNFYLKYYIQGVKIGDLDLTATLKQQLKFLSDTTANLNLKGRYLRSEVGYFLQNYNGNHDQWSNDFKKQGNIMAEFSFKLPKYFFNFYVNTSLISNYIYFDNLAEPQQYIEPINVSSIILSKRMKLGIFVFDNKICYQYNTANDILNLPALAIQNSTYVDFYFSYAGKKVLKIQTGVDVYYSTPYKAYSYHPSTGIFYINSENNTANYPVVNAFLNFKLKTTLMFFKYEHANAQLLQDYYYSVNHYHTRETFFRFGLRWWFRT